jgi:hypothetical protein
MKGRPSMNLAILEQLLSLPTEMGLIVYFPELGIDHLKGKSTRDLTFEQLKEALERFRWL